MDILLQRLADAVATQAGLAVLILLLVTLGLCWALHFVIVSFTSKLDKKDEALEAKEADLRDLMLKQIDVQKDLKNVLDRILDRVPAK